MAAYDLRINGRTQRVESSDPDKPLLYVLRGLGLTATKFGCGLGQCGACTVLVDGQRSRSCQIRSPARARQGDHDDRRARHAEKPHPVQAAFIAEQAAQCGYCTNGMVMSAAALLAQNPKPTEAEMRTALAGNLCRCGTHERVLRAVMARRGQGG